MPKTELIFCIINFFSGGISWTWTLKERWFIVKTLPQLSPLCHHFPSFYSSAGFSNRFQFVEFRILNWTRFLVQLSPFKYRGTVQTWPKEYGGQITMYYGDQQMESLSQALIVKVTTRCLAQGPVTWLFGPWRLFLSHNSSRKRWNMFERRKIIQ